MAIVVTHSSLAACNCTNNQAAARSSPPRLVGSGRRMNVTCCTDAFTSPKAGAVGERRFRDGALPGTYWHDSDIGEVEKITVSFNTGIKKVTTDAVVGENLLRVAERCGAMTPDIDFCFQGTCCHCEMEVLGGATEVGRHQAGSSRDEVVRSCICPVPRGRKNLQVNLISEADVWNERVV